MTRRAVAAFASVAVILSIVSAAVLRGRFLTYEAEVPLLVIPIGSVGPGHEIAGNLEYFSRSASFRDTLTVDSDHADRISVETASEGSMVVIRARADHPETARTVAHAAALSLSRFSSRYYNVKTGADFRILSASEPIHIIDDTGVYVIASVLAGIGLSSAMYFLLFGFPDLPDILKRRRGDLLPFDLRLFEPKRPSSSLLSDRIVPVPGSEMSVQEVFPATEEPMKSRIPVYESLPEMDGSDVVDRDAVSAIVPGKKAAAPDNLPGLTDAEQRFLDEFSFEEPAEEGVPDDIGTIETVDRIVSDIPEIHEEPEEPSVEEYQRRLNELLKG